MNGAAVVETALPQLRRYQQFPPISRFELLSYSHVMSTKVTVAYADQEATASPQSGGSQWVRQSKSASIVHQPQTTVTRRRRGGGYHSYTDSDALCSLSGFEANPTLRAIGIRFLPRVSRQSESPEALRSS